MTTQSLLPFTMRVRRTDPDTSRAAAQQSESLAKRHARIILEVMRQAGRPLAAEQIANRTDLDSVQVTRRFAEMEREELIRRTEMRHVNRRGRPTVKWEVVS